MMAARKPQSKRYPYIQVHRISATLASICEEANIFAAVPHISSDNKKPRLKILWQLDAPAGPFNEVVVYAHATTSPEGKLYDLASHILGTAPGEITVDELVPKLIGRQNLLSVSVIEHLPGKFGRPFLKRIVPAPTAVNAAQTAEPA